MKENPDKKSKYYNRTCKNHVKINVSKICPVIACKICMQTKLSLFCSLILFQKSLKNMDVLQHNFPFWAREVYCRCHIEFKFPLTKRTVTTFTQIF